tara:strand:+ start:1641 stop:1796 length:156 start_codon:yes stop_codon:yes gene_type:complete
MMEAVGEDGEDVIDIDIEIGSGCGARVEVDDIDIFTNAIIDILFYIANDDR